MTVDIFIIYFFLQRCVIYRVTKIEVSFSDLTDNTNDSTPFFFQLVCHVCLSR
jgi:hypothetical protein